MLTIFVKNCPGIITAFDCLLKAETDDVLAKRMRRFFDASASGRASDVADLADECGCDEDQRQRLAYLCKEARSSKLRFDKARIKPVFAGSIAAAAATATPLAEEDETFAIIPAAYGIEVIDHLLDDFDTLALLKVKPLVDEIIELLERRGLLATSCFIEKVESPEQRIVRDLASLQGSKVNYLSLMLVQNPKRERGALRRGCRSRREAAAAAAATD